MTNLETHIAFFEYLMDFRKRVKIARKVQSQIYLFLLRKICLCNHCIS